MKRRICSLVILLVLAFTIAVPALAAEEPLTVSVPVEIVLEGPVLDSEDTFTVELISDTAGAPMPANTQLEIVGEGSGSFVIEYATMGVFSYSIRQIAGEALGVNYDDSVYSLTVFVTRGEDGEIGITTVLSDSEGEKTGVARFVNTYDPPAPAKLDPPVEKKVISERGTAPADAEFVFAMVPGAKDYPMPDNDEVEVDSATGAMIMRKNSPGSYEFGWMTFDEDDVGKTYTYTMKEIPGEDSRFTYDPEIYTLTVKVTSKDRKVEIDVTYTNKSGENVDKAVFTNVFSEEVPPETPPTGDTNRLPLYLALFGVSAAALVVLGLTAFRKKKRN